MIRCRIIIFCCSIALLTGCFVPDRYKATLSLSNNAYSLTYIGEMHIMAVYSEIYQRNMEDNPILFAQKIEAELVRVIRERQQATVETRLVSPKLLQASFQYVSPYTHPEATGMFAMKVEGNTLTVTSRPISTKEREMIKLNNITSRGTLCIKAFGTVLETNAKQRANLIDRCNTWDLDNLDEPVRLVVAFSQSIPLPAQP